MSLHSVTTLCHYALSLPYITILCHYPMSLQSCHYSMLLPFVTIVLLTSLIRQYSHQTAVGISDSKINQSYLKKWQKGNIFSQCSLTVNGPMAHGIQCTTGPLTHTHTHTSHRLTVFVTKLIWYFHMTHTTSYSIRKLFNWYITSNTGIISIVV